MDPLCFKRHRFPVDVIKYAVWASFRFTMSFRDVEDLLAERGVLVSNESIRCSTLKFGPSDRAQSQTHAPRPDSPLASRRNGREDRWRAHVHVARRRRRRRGSRRPRPEAPQQGRRRDVLAAHPEEHGDSTRSHRHGRSLIVSIGDPRARLRRPPQAWAIAREQPGREFSPAGATA